MLLLEGAAHAYVFPTPGTKKWDTCAPEAILRACGGDLTDMLGRTLPYGETVKHMNSEGVLATAIASQLPYYRDLIPQDVKQKILHG